MSHINFAIAITKTCGSGGGSYMGKSLPGITASTSMTASGSLGKRQIAVQLPVQSAPGASCWEASHYIDRLGRYRESYYKYHTGRQWKLISNYDLCQDNCVEINKRSWN